MDKSNKLYYRFLNSTAQSCGGVVRIVDLGWSPQDQYRQHFHQVNGDPTPELVLEKLKESVQVPEWLTVEVLRVIWPGHCDNWWDPKIYECTVTQDSVLPKTGELDSEGRLVKYET